MTACVTLPVSTSLPPMTSGISMPLALHLLEPQLEARALGRARRVVADRLVHRRRRAEDPGRAHERAFYGGVQRGRVRGPGLGRRRALARRASRLVYHELPTAGSRGPTRSTIRWPSACARTSAGSRVAFDDVELEVELGDAVPAGARRRPAAVPCGRGRDLRRARRARRPSERAPRRRHLLRREPLPALRPLPPRRRRGRASAATARSASSTSAGCWRWRASSC